ncbi:unnamed protein product [Cylindrotheca closterium]|uniref:Histone deacetylase domain-containing protein n=1 Tax=Cylindrotheca closterium TaxID=2856 RepID=A0AAD2GA94_9STRA|nr:unnamed protein product [Cylindrotheca closterium]
MSNRKISVCCRHHPDSISWDKDESGAEEPVLGSVDLENDNLDLYNHPRYRRAMILKELATRRSDEGMVTFETPSQAASNLDIYRKIHSDRLIDFFASAWKLWDGIGPDGQDSMCNGGGGKEASSPALIPGNIPLPRERFQRPSKNVMGQIGFFCTDTCTPVFGAMLEEILWDGAVIEQAVATLQKSPSVVAYALGTHPGHHSAEDSFGGYCYVNHSALAAKLLQERNGYSKVAVLDVDYHCGNGTASIFYQDPSVLVVSIHCHPDWDYPFHSGFSEETGDAEGEGATLHLPLMPGTNWETYGDALQSALTKIQDFGAEALVVSLGLDTYLGDPCAVRRAGFRLEGDDYTSIGMAIGSSNLPTMVVQEGGYKMDSVPQAATDFLFGICAPVE